MSQYDYQEDEGMKESPPLPVPTSHTRKIAIEAARGNSVISKQLETFYRTVDIDKGVKVDNKSWWMEL